MQLRAEEISQIIKKQIQSYEKTALTMETGTVLSVGDGIARIYGLEGAMAGELLEFPGNLMGLVLNLESDNVGSAIFGDTTTIKEGAQVKRTGRIMEVPVGEALCGRVVNALGQPIDGKGPIETPHKRRVEIKAPGILARQPVKEGSLAMIARAEDLRTGTIQKMQASKQRLEQRSAEGKPKSSLAATFRSRRDDMRARGLQPASEDAAAERRDLMQRIKDIGPQVREAMRAAAERVRAYRGREAEKATAGRRRGRRI